MKIFLALLIASVGAWAGEPSESERQEAATRLERGVKLFESQDSAAPLAQFQAAYRIVPRYQVLFNVGVTEKRLFRLQRLGALAHALSRRGRRQGLTPGSGASR